MQDIDKRDFTLRHLQQLVAVAPHAYRLAWVQKADRYHLTVDFELRAAGEGGAFSMAACDAAGRFCGGLCRGHPAARSSRVSV